MNAPEYIVVDELGTVTASTKTALPLTVLNYQYGYIKELNETLQEWDKDPANRAVRFPLTWIEQPMNIICGESGAYWGRIELLRVFFMLNTVPNKKAPQRMTDSFKAVLYPLKREWLNQLDLSIAFHTDGIQKLKHIEQDVYYWGDQANVLTNPVDCHIITIRDLLIANNPNCTPTTNMGGIVPAEE